MPRKFVQVTATTQVSGPNRNDEYGAPRTVIVGLCDDGTVWLTDDDEMGKPDHGGEPTWRRLGDVPQDDDPKG